MAPSPRRIWKDPAHLERCLKERERELERELGTLLGQTLSSRSDAALPTRRLFSLRLGIHHRSFRPNGLLQWAGSSDQAGTPLEVFYPVNARLVDSAVRHSAPLISCNRNPCESSILRLYKIFRPLFPVLSLQHHFLSLESREKWKGKPAGRATRPPGSASPWRGETLSSSGSPSRLASAVFSLATTQVRDRIKHSWNTYVF